MQRPTGVTVLAILEFVGGALGILGGCGLIGLGALGGAAGAASGKDSAIAAVGLGALGAVLGVVLLALAVGGLVVGFGLWTLKKWAWNAARILSLISIVFGIIQLAGGVFGGGSPDFSPLLGIALNAFIVYYLNQPAVKQAFA